MDYPWYKGSCTKWKFEATIKSYSFCPKGYYTNHKRVERQWKRIISSVRTIAMANVPYTVYVSAKWRHLETIAPITNHQKTNNYERWLCKLWIIRKVKVVRIRWAVRKKRKNNSRNRTRGMERIRMPMVYCSRHWVLSTNFFMASSEVAAGETSYQRPRELFSV